MIEFVQAGFAYDGASERVLDGISLTLEPGDHVCVLGATGTGKTALAELAAGIKEPTSGNVIREGTAVYIGQDSRASMVSTLVFDEVAFGLRCAGYSGKAVKGRTMAALGRLGIRRLAHCATADLSAGEQQLVALAAAIALEPDHLVLDDPFALLDSASAKMIADLVNDLVKAGVVVLETTSSLVRAMDADRIVLLGKGVRPWTGTFDELLASDDLLARLGLTDDTTMVLLRAVAHEGFRFTTGTTPDDVLAYINANHLAQRIGRAVTPARGDATFTPAHKLDLRDADVLYGDHAALKGASLSVGDELVLVVGPAGSGKSTLAVALAGAVPLDGGELALDGDRPQPGRVGLLLQQAQDQLFAKTVRADIAYGLRGDKDKRSAAGDSAATHAASAFGITDLLDRTLRSLSLPEKRLVALAGVDAAKPDALILDDPCAGLDAAGRNRVHRMVQHARAKHLPVVIIASELEEWLATASRVIFMRDGAIAYDCDGAAAQTRTQPYVSYGLEPPIAVMVRTAAGMGARRRESRG